MGAGTRRYRHRLRWRVWFALALPGAAALAGCERGEWSFADDVAVAGGAGTGSGGSGGSGVIVGIAGAGGDRCALDRSLGTEPLFARQVVSAESFARREVYAYVTESEAASLRASGTLFPSETEPRDATERTVETQLTNAALNATQRQRELIAQLLPRFARVRSLWPNPWALRLVDHAGTQRMAPVRVVLRRDAWLARIKNQVLGFVDLENQQVASEQVAQDPGRVTALYFDTAPGFGSGDPLCERAERRLVLASESGVESWSLGTPEVRARVTDDLVLLNSLFDLVRPCASVDRGSSFRSVTACSTWANPAAATEYLAYGLALSIPEELYKPSAQNLAGLIEALEQDHLEPDPFTVGADSE